jgi:hypothetical protein
MSAARRHRTAGALIVAAALAATPAQARTPWLELGADAGSARFDGSLADYQWDVTPGRAFGAQAIAGLGRFGLGGRGSTNATTQRLALDGVPDPRVTATRLELVGRARLVTALGCDVQALASGGRQRLVYEPSRLDLPSGGGPPVTVDLKPVDGWIAGTGMALTRRISGPWRASLAITHRWFALDTAHQAGGTVVDQRQTFGMWDAQVGVNWLAPGR